MTRTVADVMHVGVTTCAPDALLMDVARWMDADDVSAIPVVDREGFLIGIITRTDLLTLLGYDEYWRTLCAEHAMTREVVTVTPEQPLLAAVQLLAARRIHRLIVVEPDASGRQHPIGVLSQTDIAREMVNAAQHA